MTYFQCLLNGRVLRITLFFLWILLPIKGYAFYSIGEVGLGIDYSDLEVSYKTTKKSVDQRPNMISGYLKNKTGKPISFQGVLYFDNYFDRHTGKATISETIP
nr:hypothetical protein [Desulfobacteraceae bacterium]